MSNLVKTASLEQLSQAFLFEPNHLVPFEIAWNWQRTWQRRMLFEAHLPEAVWLLQHEICYTLGRGASEKNLLFNPKDPSFELHRIDRGGEVTHHLPGQLIAYPVLNLHRHKTDLNWYLRQLEQVLIDVLALLGLKGQRIQGLTGIWLDGIKVAAIGVGCRRWITQHGLALNIDCDLEGFKAVVPCGLVGHSVGRLNQWIPGLRVCDVQPLLRNCIAVRLGLIFEKKDCFEIP